MGTSEHAARMRWQHQCHLAINFRTAPQRLNRVEFELVAIERADDSHGLSATSLSRHLFRRLFWRIGCWECELHFAIGIDVDRHFAATDQFAEQ